METKTLAVVLMAIATVEVIGTAETLVQHVLAAVNNVQITDCQSGSCTFKNHQSNLNSYNNGAIRSNSGAPSPHGEYMK